MTAEETPYVHYGRWLAWTVFCLACLTLAWARIEANEQFQADRKAQQFQRNRLMELGKQRMKDVSQIFKPYPVARETIEAELNDGQPLDLQAEGDRQQATWVDPVSGQQWRLSFKDDVLVGHSSHWGTADAVRRYPHIDRADYAGLSEWIRSRLAQLGVWAWLALLPLLMLRQARRVAAELLLATAILCTAAWALSPHYSNSVPGIFANDNLFFGVLMLAVSAIVLGFSAPGRGWPQFRLRGMLAATALFAGFFTLGPLGLAGAAAMVVGAGLFFVASRLAPLHCGAET